MGNYEGESGRPGRKKGGNVKELSKGDLGGRGGGPAFPRAKGGDSNSRRPEKAGRTKEKASQESLLAPLNKTENEGNAGKQALTPKRKGS